MGDCNHAECVEVKSHRLQVYEIPEYNVNGKWFDLVAVHRGSFLHPLAQLHEPRRQSSLRAALLLMWILY